VRELNDIIKWFIRLLRRDEAEYDVDKKTKRRIYKTVIKENNIYKEKKK
jgi:hypothetical protein